MNKFIQVSRYIYDKDNRQYNYVGRMILNKDRIISVGITSNDVLVICIESSDGTESTIYTREELSDFCVRLNS